MSSIQAYHCMPHIPENTLGNDIFWSTVQYMVSSIQYGGKVTDDLDRRFRCLRCVAEPCKSASFSFNPSVIGQIENNFNYNIPNAYDHAEYARFCASFPEVDSPEISGLHPNADLTFRVQEATRMMRALSNVSLTGGGGGSGEGGCMKMAMRNHLMMWHDMATA